MQAVTPCMEEQPNEVEEVLKLFGGDARKALSEVLRDCHHLHEQLRLTSGAMSVSAEQLENLFDLIGLLFHTWENVRSEGS